MTIDKFTEIVEDGGDIMFDFEDKHYVIEYWTDCPICICEQITTANSREFETVEEMLENYIIDGKPLKDYVKDIKITFKS